MGLILDYIRYNIEDHKDALRRIIDIISMSEKVEGIAKQSRQPYKIETDGKYGNLQIDVPQFDENKRLVVTGGGGGSIMMHKNVYSDLIDLLTERMETKKETIPIYVKIF